MSLLKIITVSLLCTFVISLYLYPNLRSLKWIYSGLNQFSLRRRAAAIAVGPFFGLKISLMLASFYAAQGFAGLLNVRQFKAARNHSSLINSIPFHFMEIPVLLGLIIFGSVVVPVGGVQYYTKVLEVISLMTVVMAAGRKWTPQIVESHDFIKVLVILGCFASFLVSSTAFYFIYANFRLSTLISSLLSSILTLIIVEILACCQLDHATIIDPAFIFPYISYNLILITLKSGVNALLDHQRDPQIYPKNPQYFLKIVEFIFNTTPNASLIRQIIQTIFSPVLILHILLQLALLTVADSDVNERDCGNEHDSGQKSSLFILLYNLRKFIVTNLWPLFGKSFLIIIYTISWLEQCHPETLTSAISVNSPFILDSTGFWRWIAVAVAISVYGKHLIFDGYQHNSAGIFWR